MKLKLIANYVNNESVSEISATGTGTFNQAYDRAYNKLVKEINKEVGSFYNVRYSQYNEHKDSMTGEVEWKFMGEYSK